MFEGPALFMRPVMCSQTIKARPCAVVRHGGPVFEGPALFMRPVMCSQTIKGKLAL